MDLSSRTEPLIFSGTSHPELAQQIAAQLGVNLGCLDLGSFPDGEVSVQVKESVRGRDVFVVQSIAGRPNYYLMELLILIDALKRASAKSIVAVISYFGYCRQDRKDRPRVPITAKLVANLVVNAGATRVLTMDLHAGQVQGFFDIPVDHISARPVLAAAVTEQEERRDDLVVVTPDIGSVKLSFEYAGQLGVDLAIVQKHRFDPSKVEAVTLIGDVRGKDVLLADDMCSTASTLVSAAKACQEKGARRIFAAVTHGLFVGNALELIEQSPLEKVFVSNTIPASEAVLQSKKIVVVSIAELFGRAIRCIVSHQSISTLFAIEKVVPSPSRCSSEEC
ncbi:MAG: ribose-phosphate pyrophosphokinae [Chlamydiales bacterium]|nr:ribose-phosphate pyrophosphokinae [Chlamydiales bacterium]